MSWTHWSGRREYSRPGGKVYLVMGTTDMGKRKVMSTFSGGHPSAIRGERLGGDVFWIEMLWPQGLQILSGFDQWQLFKEEVQIA